MLCVKLCILNYVFEHKIIPYNVSVLQLHCVFILGVFHVSGFLMYKFNLLLLLFMNWSIFHKYTKYIDCEENVISTTAKAVI